jgi:hypothetical protein
MKSISRNNQAIDSYWFIGLLFSRDVADLTRKMIRLPINPTDTQMRKENGKIIYAKCRALFNISPNGCSSRAPSDGLRRLYGSPITRVGNNNRIFDNTGSIRASPVMMSEIARYALSPLSCLVVFFVPPSSAARSYISARRTWQLQSTYFYVHCHGNSVQNASATPADTASVHVAGTFTIAVKQGAFQGSLLERALLPLVAENERALSAIVSRERRNWIGGKTYIWDTSETWKIGYLCIQCVYNGNLSRFVRDTGRRRVCTTRYYSVHFSSLFEFERAFDHHINMI